MSKSSVTVLPSYHAPTIYTGYQLPCCLICLSNPGSSPSYCLILSQVNRGKRNQVAYRRGPAEQHTKSAVTARPRRSAMTADKVEPHLH